MITFSGVMADILPPALRKHIITLAAGVARLLG
jgi:hypothetical protein